MRPSLPIFALALSIIGCESPTYDRAAVVGTWDDGQTLGSTSRWVLTADGKGAEYHSERKPGEKETKWPEQPAYEFTWEADEAGHRFKKTLVARDGKPLPKEGQPFYVPSDSEPKTFEYELRTGGKKLNLKRGGNYLYNWKRASAP